MAYFVFAEIDLCPYFFGDFLPFKGRYFLLLETVLLFRISSEVLTLHWRVSESIRMWFRLVM